MPPILQAGGIISPELVIIALIAVVLFAIPLVVSLLIYRDAKRRESGHAVAWASASFFCASLGSFFAGLVFWVFYLVVRDELGPDEPPAGTGA